MARWQGEIREEKKAAGMEAKTDKGASRSQFNEAGPSSG